MGAKQYIPVRPGRLAPTSHEAARRSVIPVEDAPRRKAPLSDAQILAEYQKLPFVNRIVKMGVSKGRVRRIVREWETLGTPGQLSSGGMS